VKFMLDRVGVAMIRVLSKSYQTSEILHKKLVSQWARKPNLSMSHKQPCEEENTSKQTLSTLDINQI
jgi:hypothetical protein